MKNKYVTAKVIANNENLIYVLRTQPCPLCKEEIGDMPGMRDAVCHNCGFKDPCCE